MLNLLFMGACNVPTEILVEIVYSDISLNAETELYFLLLYSIIILRHLSFILNVLQKAMAEQDGSSNNASELFGMYVC
jgi:hypothetical protein